MSAPTYHGKPCRICDTPAPALRYVGDHCCIACKQRRDRERTERRQAERAGIPAEPRQRRRAVVVTVSPGSVLCVCGRPCPPRRWFCLDICKDSVNVDFAAVAVRLGVTL